jgi:hypothetical protein
MLVPFVVLLTTHFFSIRIREAECDRFAAVMCFAAGLPRFPQIGSLLTSLPIVLVPGRSD